jgi:hypothetical protein
MSLAAVLTIVLFLALLGSMPNWPYSRNWGYGPVLVIALLLVGVVYVLLNFPGML